MMSNEKGLDPKLQSLLDLPDEIYVMDLNDPDFPEKLAALFNVTEPAPPPTQETEVRKQLKLLCMIAYLEGFMDSKDRNKRDPLAAWPQTAVYKCLTDAI